MERKDYRLAAILYTDITGFSKMLEKNEKRTLELLNIHNGLIKEVVQAHQGTVIKTIGDAFLIDFKNTVDALQSAIEIQFKLLAHNKAHPDLPLLVRMGLHLGDIFFYENDALGEGINIANRLQSITRPGCICISQDVYNLVLNKVNFTAEKLGPVRLKNISKEIHVYEIITPNIDFDQNRHNRSVLVPEQPDEDQTQPFPESLTHSALTGADDSGFQRPIAQEVDIKRRILLDIKAAGRRLTADQMLLRYGHQGPAAAHIIEDLTSKGFLLAQTKTKGENIRNNPFDSREPPPRQGLFSAVTDLEYLIEDEIKRSFEAFSRRHQSRSNSLRQADRKIRSELRKEMIAEQQKSRRLHKNAMVDDKWDAKIAKSYFKSNTDSISEYDSYTANVRTETRKTKAGFIGHLASFLTVNTFLMVINGYMSPGFPWALFPFGGWGIGIMEHFGALLRRNERAKELARLPPMDDKQLSLFKKIQKKRDSIFLHLTSTVTTSLFLIMINLITSFGFFWSLFPVGGMMIGLISHIASFFTSKQELEQEFLTSIGLSGSWQRALRRPPRPIADQYGDLGPYRDLLDTAITTRTAILAQSASGGPKTKSKTKQSSYLDSQFTPTLNSYVDQIALIAKRTLELDQIIELMPMEALKKDKVNLETKLAADPSETLQREYQKSLQEIENQELSFRQLKDQREVLELRLRSSVNALKQLRIDLARLQSMPEHDDSTSIQAVHDKTLELNRYLEDLRAGYSELENLDNPRFQSLEDPNRE